MVFVNLGSCSIREVSSFQRIVEYVLCVILRPCRCVLTREVSSFMGIINVFITFNLAHVSSLERYPLFGG